MPSQRNLMGRLYANSQRSLRDYVLRLVASGDSADEIVQEAFLRTYENFDRLETPRAFLFATARNLASTLRRTIRTRKTETVGDLEIFGLESKKGPEQVAIAEEELHLLRQAIAQLPPQCAAVFTLRILHACSYKDIAGRMGISPRTVENHLARALRDVHQYLHRPKY